MFQGTFFPSVSVPNHLVFDINKEYEHSENVNNLEIALIQKTEESSDGKRPKIYDVEMNHQLNSQAEVANYCKNNFEPDNSSKILKARKKEGKKKKWYKRKSKPMKTKPKKISIADILWTTMKESRKAFGVYADFIKDLLFLMIIIQAVGGVQTLQESPNWTFAHTIVLGQFLSLWVPMFLATLRLTASYAGFSIGYETTKRTSKVLMTCLRLTDLILFVFSPIILKFQLSVLKKYQDGIKQSRNQTLKERYGKNSVELVKLKHQFNIFKKLELNLETIIQMTLSVILYLYSTSETRTSQSLLAVINKNSTLPTDEKTEKQTCFDISFSNENPLWLKIDVLKCLPPLLVISLNFFMSFLSFTRSQMKGVTGHRKFNPMKSKIILGLYLLLSCILRETSLVMYFSPTLGLFNLLRHLQAEQIPFLKTYNGTSYCDTTKVLQEMIGKIQRGTWTDPEKVAFINYVSTSGLEGGLKWQFLIIFIT